LVHPAREILHVLEDLAGTPTRHSQVLFDVRQGEVEQCLMRDFM
jgi:hypothetical protein